MTAEYDIQDSKNSIQLDATLSSYIGQVTSTFSNLLASVALAVTDTTFNVAAKIADCEKESFASYDLILKQVKTDVGLCFKGYATDDKYFIGNVTLLFKSISEASLTPLNNVTLCLKSNALTDVKSINAANNCTTAALVTCLGYVSLLNLENWNFELDQFVV